MWQPDPYRKGRTCFDGPNVDFTVALAFTGLAEGLTDLTITSNGMAGYSVEIAPCNPGACKFNPVSLNPTLVSASARIEPIPPPGVPEPSILALAGLGLLGLLSTRRGAAGTDLGVPGQDRRTKIRFTISTGWATNRRTKGLDPGRTLPRPIGRQNLAEWLAQQP
ncbi:MAG: PEP-CTERM sorting domain-containing protein [Candidatus Accumulibacter phosphatis]|uniref:PEP-CTERM sorting domain-containing protein n=1 Tax=Candidatus Accumulibacter contiguus TaxID=2954381 RepID=UPI00207BA181|nr:PEP-CTERM sorting domain-containing protein [Candidatus Accumulibacter contiguus]